MHPATESNSIFSYQMHNHLPALIVLYHLCVLSSWTLKSCFLFSCILVLLYSCFLVFTVFYFVVFSFTHRSVNKNLQRLQTNSRKIEWSNPALGFLRRLFTIVRCILVLQMPVNQRNGLVSNDYGCSWWLSFLLNKIAWQSFAIYHFLIWGAN